MTFSFLLLVLLLPSMGWAAVTHTNTSSAFIASPTSDDVLGANFTCTDNNTVVYVTAYINEETTNTTDVIQIEYGSLLISDFTNVSTVTTPSSGTRRIRVQVWRVLPGAQCTGGSRFLTVTIESQRIWSWSAVAFTGVNLSDPDDTPVSVITNGSAAVDPSPGAVSSAVGDLVVSWVGRESSGILDIQSGHTEYADTLTGASGTANVRAVVGGAPGAASVTMQWDSPGGAGEWVAIGMNLNALSATATYWVAKTGSDSNSCSAAQSESTPKLTITAGAACASPGDTVIVKAGTYAEDLDNQIPGGTSWAAPVTVKTNAPDVVTVQPPAVSGFNAAFTFTTSASQYIIVDGFVLDGSSETEGSGIIIDNEAHHIRVNNVEIKNFWNQGILVSTETSAVSGFGNNNIFYEITVHDNGTAPDGVIPANQQHGLYIETDNNLVDGCWVYNHTGHGLHLFSSHAWQPNDNTFTRCFVENSGTMGVGLYGTTGNKLTNSVIYDAVAAGVKIGGSGTTVDNNTIYSTTEHGIYADSGGNHIIRNNIITHSGDYGIWLLSTLSGGLVVQNNLFFSNTDGNIQNDEGATITGTVTGDPLYANAANEEFNVLLGSPAIDAGVTISSITTDCCGHPRPQNGVYDIGGFEFEAGGRRRVPAPPRLLEAEPIARLVRWRQR